MYFNLFDFPGLKCSVQILLLVYGLCDGNEAPGGNPYVHWGSSTNPQRKSFSLGKISVKYL